MKKIECVIQQGKLAGLTEKLLLAGIGGMTVTEVKGFGKDRTRPENFLFLPKTKIEIYCADAQVKEITAVIIKECRTSKLGDGKIAISELKGLIRIRTGEKGNKAIF